jgi:hypothetical protein
MVGAPCSTKWIDEFGYVTIPTLALTAFAAIFVLCLSAVRQVRSGRDEQVRPDPAGEPLATAPHDVIVIPGEHRPGDGR